MKKIIIFLLLFLVMSPNISKSENKEIYSFSVDEQKLLNAAFQQIWFKNNESDKIIVLQEKTSISIISFDLNSLTEAAESEDEFFQEAFSDFIKKNEKEIFMDFNEESFAYVRSISQSELDELFSMNDSSTLSGWDKFYKKYQQSGGIVEISLPGFSSDKKIAIVYLRWQSHYLSGYGAYWIFRKKNEEWVLQKETFGPVLMS